mgnify:CR=1 FL=1
MFAALAQTIRNPIAGFGVVLVAVAVIAVVAGVWFTGRRR